MIESIIDAGHNLIISVQAWRNPMLDALFHTLTFLGSEDFLLVMLLALWWVLDKRLAQRALPLVLAAIWFSLWLKVVFGQPRPFDPAVAVLVEESSFGFPSTHALIGVVVWGFLAWHARRAWALWLAGILAFGIGLSRIYLGIHFPHDVVGGWLLGLISLWAYVAALPWLARLWTQISLFVQTTIGVALPLLMFLIFNADPNAQIVVGVLAGTGLAIPSERRWINFHAWDGTIWQKIMRLIVGVIGVLAIRAGGKALFPDTAVVDFLRYALIGVWVAGAALWCFGVLRLAPRSEQPQQTQAASQETEPAA